MVAPSRDVVDSLVDVAVQDMDGHLALAMIVNIGPLARLPTQAPDSRNSFLSVSRVQECGRTRPFLIEESLDRGPMLGGEFLYEIRRRIGLVVVALSVALVNPVLNV